jgi:hypothetical protein
MIRDYPFSFLPKTKKEQQCLCEEKKIEDLENEVKLHAQIPVRCV